MIWKLCVSSLFMLFVLLYASFVVLSYFVKADLEICYLPKPQWVLPCPYIKADCNLTIEDKYQHYLNVFICIGISRRQDQHLSNRLFLFLFLSVLGFERSLADFGGSHLMEDCHGAAQYLKISWSMVRVNVVVLVLVLVFFSCSSWSLTFHNICSVLW